LYVTKVSSLHNKFQTYWILNLNIQFFSDVSEDIGTSTFRVAHDELSTLMCNKLFRSICDYTPIYTVSYSKIHDFFISIIVRGENIALTHSPKVKVPLHAMKPHGKVVAYLHSFWNLVLGGGDLSPSCTDCVIPKKICGVPIVQDVGWTPESVCETLQRTEVFLP
jgi:hypothetical protein